MNKFLGVIHIPSLDIFVIVTARGKTKGGIAREVIGQSHFTLSHGHSDPFPLFSRDPKQSPPPHLASQFTLRTPSNYVAMMVSDETR